MVTGLHNANKVREVCEAQISDLHCYGGWGAEEACPRCLKVWGL